MGCCGDRTIMNPTITGQVEGGATSDILWQVEYIGTGAGTRTYTGVATGQTYRFNSSENGKYQLVNPADVPGFNDFPQLFKVNPPLSQEELIALVSPPAPELTKAQLKEAEKLNEKAGALEAPDVQEEARPAKRAK